MNNKVKTIISGYIKLSQLQYQIKRDFRPDLVDTYVTLRRLLHNVESVMQINNEREW